MTDPFTRLEFWTVNPDKWTDTSPTHTYLRLALLLRKAASR